jgi:predicted metal-dependent peptidase
MVDNERVKKLSDRLMRSRIRILQDYGFFGLLLMHVKFAIDESCGSTGTEGERIYFDPGFVDKLSDFELDFIMMHEILHVVLKHCFRGENYNHDAFNIACDIVVNSNIMKSMNRIQPIVLKHFGEAMHLAPNGQEGHLYTAEEVYDMLPKLISIEVIGDDSSPIGDRSDKARPAGRASSGGDIRSSTREGVEDNHDKWGSLEPDKAADLQQEWGQRIIGAAEAEEARVNALCCANYSKELIDRILKKLKEPQLDWRTILNTFVQEEITDYSFTPPDRRFDESPFFLPDFNEKEEFVKDILFMIDTSRSMSDQAVTTVFSEVKGSIEQFDGRLCGKLGFFLYKVVPPVDFSSVDEVLKIMPKGGGGTSFKCVFEYVDEHMKYDPPACIIMLTDGHGNWPDERMANDIPVLWLLTNDFVNPPWGKIARIKI